MSNTLKGTSIDKFIEKVRADKTLLDKLRAAQENFIGKKADREEAAKALIIIAKEAGIPFTEDDLKEWETKMMADMDGAELSENELKAVSGGLSCFIVYGYDGSDASCYFVGKDGDWDDSDTYCILIGKD